jgi:hypothetical protein
VLGAAGHVCLDALLGQLLAQALTHLLDVGISTQAFLGKLLDQPSVGFRFQILEGQVLQRRLDLRNPQPTGQRRVNLSCVERNALLLVARLGIERPHVVQTVRQLHDHHPWVLGHRQEHLAHVFRLQLGPVGSLPPIIDLGPFHGPQAMTMANLAKL